MNNEIKRMMTELKIYANMAREGARPDIDTETVLYELRHAVLNIRRAHEERTVLEVLDKVNTDLEFDELVGVA